MSDSNIPVLTDVVSLGALVPAGTEAPTPNSSTKHKYDDPEEATQTVFVMEPSPTESSGSEFSLGDTTPAPDSEAPTVFNLDDSDTDNGNERDELKALVDEAIPRIMPELEKLARKTLLDLMKAQKATKKPN